MVLKTPVGDVRSPAAPARRVWYAAPGVGPAPRMRRRLIAVVPVVSGRRRLRWQAGTVVPGVGPTARMQRRGRAATRAGTRAARLPLAATRAARAVDWPALTRAASTMAATPRRRRRPRRSVLVGAAGVAGAGAAAIMIAKRRSREAAMVSAP